MNINDWINDTISNVELKLTKLEGKLDKWNTSNIQSKLGGKCAKINQLIVAITNEEGLTQDQQNRNEQNLIKTQLVPYILDTAARNG